LTEKNQFNQNNVLYLSERLTNDKTSDTNKIVLQLCCTNKIMARHDVLFYVQ